MEPAAGPVPPTAPGGIRRGALTVAPRVVEKIAAVAAAGVRPVGAPPPRVVRWTARWRSAGLSGAVADSGGLPGGLPAVSARLGGGTVRLAVSISVAYPVPLLEVAREVRELIRHRVTALTGLQVTSIEINVLALAAPEGNLVEVGPAGTDGHA